MLRRSVAIASGMLLPVITGVEPLGNGPRYLGSRRSNRLRREDPSPLGRSNTTAIRRSDPPIRRRRMLGGLISEYDGVAA